MKNCTILSPKTPKNDLLNLKLRPSEQLHRYKHLKDY